MNATTFHKFGIKAYNHIRMRCSISNSIIHTTHADHKLQLSNAFFSRYHPRTTIGTVFSVPVRRFSSKANGTKPSVTNSGPIWWYLSMIKARPILTKSVTSALIYTAADLTSQTITRSSSEPYDFIRTCRMAGFGMVILGPTLHFWFNFISRVLPRQDLVTTFKKMLMGQTILGPIMNALFFSVNAALQGENVQEIIARLKRDMLPTMMSNAIYWPLCDFITFRAIPVHLQPLANNSFAYVWTIYITYMASLSKAGPN
ncbi:hypothetical protein QVD17_14598 [Tagetes erecta]|uniref:PXMP2/4 family protein 4 n=1 Tax=Tagetes erecta TaxID=13708 RepID=A0AAD8KZ64_TARER|nr:hypothetical protein QVD17_14598 [Tagetes erecta]